MHTEHTESLTVADLGLLPCRACGLVCRRDEDIANPQCPRCTAALGAHKPDSIRRTWAFLLAAMILYLPANLLPIMQTSSLLENHSDTILSGVLVLWTKGSWDLAIIVFVASIVVPFLKFTALLTLLITVSWAPHWRPRERTRLYRMIQVIGQWSMLDMFVVALLVSLFHFQSVAEVRAGPGAVAFAAVVVLTMVATMSFDPRLIWDTPPRHD